MRYHQGKRGIINTVIKQKTSYQLIRLQRNSKRRLTNPVMTWIDHKKVDSMVSQSWINESFKRFWTVSTERDFLNSSMKSQKLELNLTVERNQGKLQLKKFSRMAFFPFCYFFYFMFPLIAVLRRVKACYEWAIRRSKLIMYCS